MIFARFVLHLCRRLERPGRKSFCDEVLGPIPVYKGCEVLSKSH